MLLPWRKTGHMHIFSGCVIHLGQGVRTCGKGVWIMKAALFFIAILGLLMLMIPFFMLEKSPAAQDEPAEARGEAPLEPSGYIPEQIPHGPPDYPVDTTISYIPAESRAALRVEEFNILDQATGEVFTVPVRDFVRGAVAAEMPPRFHTEALKAQAVAAHTYALSQRIRQQRNPDPELRGADFAADPEKALGFLTEEQAREIFGEAADEYWGKISQAADSVLDFVLIYNEEPIVAAFHAMSAGITENAATVWEGSAPYLIPSQSLGDPLAPGFETRAAFSAREFREALLNEYPHMDFSGEESGWIGEITRSESGYVTGIEIGGVNLHGKEIRRIFDLRSHNFQAYINGDHFEFVVYGYGHGVGLSQYGADFMARQGYGFKEILENYYPGATLVIM
jgi:stage II sporulation protein D